MNSGWCQKLRRLKEEGKGEGEDTIKVDCSVAVKINFLDDLLHFCI